MKQIAVIGTGVIGSGWAAFCAAHGLSVRIYDSARERLAACLGQAEAVASFLAAHRLAPAGAARPPEPASSPAEAVDGADLVFEAVPEEYTTKRAVLRGLDRLCPPGVIIASSSSGFPISRFQRALSHPERALVVHPLNPPYLMPLVEIVPGRRTDPSVAAAVRAFLERMGKVCVTLHKEVPGFVVNRIAAAVWREAIDLAGRGVADIADIDRAIAAGPCLGWSIQGPFLTYQIGSEGGLTSFLAHLTPAFESWWADLASWRHLDPAAARSLVGQVERAYGGVPLRHWADERDRKLPALLELHGYGPGREEL